MRPMALGTGRPAAAGNLWAARRNEARHLGAKESQGQPKPPQKKKLRRTEAELHG